MKKLIILVLLLSITAVCYADKPLTIIIRNNTESMVIVYIDSIDHDVVIDGRIYPFPMPVCGGEIDPKEDFVLQPRNYNKAPYRYIITVCRTKNRQIISRVKTIFTIEPGKNEHIIIIGENDG